MDHRRFFNNGESSRPGIDAFFRRTASEAQDPALRGAARYYLAAGLARAVIESWRFSIAHVGHPERALDEDGERDSQIATARSPACGRAPHPFHVVWDGRNANERIHPYR